MLKKITIMMASTLFSTHLLAKSQLSIEYDLKPQTPEIIINYTLYTITGECTYTLQEESATVHVKVLSRSGEINGQPVQEGDEFSVVVHNGSHMTLQAKPAARVELINEGNFPIHASCHTI